MIFSSQKERRILVIDDNPSIHDDYRKILCPQSRSNELNDLEAELFGEKPAVAAEAPSASFKMDSALQGQQALAMVKEALHNGAAYSMAFVDMRMPPGWDGLRTIEELLKADPNLKCVVCSAYSDYTREQITEKLELHEGFLFIRKPFEPTDIRNVAIQMTDLKAA